MTVREVDVFLPRFEPGSALDLEARLSDLGMPLPFTLAADFSGMNGRTPPHRGALHISAVRHQAVVEVNEEGTEAAAATAVTMVALGIRRSTTPIPVFRADHPFLFAIRDRKSGVLLFLGRVVDPTRR